MKYRIKIKLLGLIPLKQFTATPINPKKLASAVYGYMGFWGWFCTIEMTEV